MRRSAPLPKDAGLSLVEVLAALAIVALMAGTTVIYMGGRPSDTRRAADGLVVSLAEAREFALVSGEVIGFAADFDQRGWRFFHAPDGQWEVMNTHPALDATRLPSGISIFIEDGALPRREDAADLEAPQVMFDPAGFDHPFSYVVRGEDEGFRVVRDHRGSMALASETGQRRRAS